MRAVLGAVLTPEVVESRLFAQWDALNWKGKLQWAAKRALLTLGVHGDNEKLFFVARRPPA